MNWLSKNWWILLVIAVVVAVIWYYYSQMNTSYDPKTKDKVDCSKYTADIAAVEQQIDDDSDWSTQVDAMTRDSNHGCYGKTYEQCRKNNAAYLLFDQGSLPESCYLAITSA